MSLARRTVSAASALLLAGCATGVDYGPVRHAAFVAHPRCAPPQGTGDDAGALPLFLVTSRLPDCRSDSIALLRHRGDRLRHGRFAPGNAGAENSRSQPDPSLAFVHEEDWWASLKAATERHNGRLVLYVHGYRETFATTARDAAQIGRMTGLEPAVVAYSWPSQGDLLGYAVDETNMYHDASNFRDFLLQLASKEWASDIVIVAHSLAARLVIPAIQHADQYSPRSQAGNMSTIILASPDIDRDTFDRDIVDEVLAPRHVARGRRLAVYVSLMDRALAASRTLHGYPRLGSPYCFDPGKAEDLEEQGLPRRCYAKQHDGLVIIDTTDASRGNVGHSNYLRSAAACRDFIAVVKGTAPPSRTATHLPHVFRLLAGDEKSAAADREACNLAEPAR